MKGSSALALAGLASAEISAPLNSLVPPPNTVKIGSISYGGTGCPQGSVGSFISADRSTYTLIFDKYVAAVGPGKTISDSRKNCQINVDLLYPSGYQFSVYSQNYRGFVSLDPGVKATQRATFYFSGASAQAQTSTNFAGPVSKDYLITDSIPFASNVYSPCGQEGALNINTQISIDNGGNPNANGQLTTDSIDGKVELKYGLSWQTCGSGPPSEFTGNAPAATYNGGAPGAPPSGPPPGSAPDVPPPSAPPVDVPPPANIPPPPPVVAPPPVAVPPPPPVYNNPPPPPPVDNSPPPPPPIDNSPPPVDNSPPPPSGGFGGFGPGFGNGFGGGSVGFGPGLGNGFGGHGGFGPGFEGRRGGREEERRRRECRNTGGEWIVNPRFPDGECRRNRGPISGFRTNDNGRVHPF